MQHHKRKKRARNPEPGYFDKEDVEEVGFSGEVAGGLRWGVGLGDGVVGGVAGGGVEEGEEGAEEEGRGVGG